jgi:hypothetical protein
MTVLVLVLVLLLVPLLRTRPLTTHPRLPAPRAV